MLIYNVIYFINIIITGIIFVFPIIINLYDSKILCPKIHSLYWFVIFIFLIFNTLEYRLFTELNISDYIIYFIPIFALFYLLNLINDKFKLYFLLIFLIPAASILFEFSFPLFSLFYDFTVWTSVIVFSVIVFKIISKNDIINKRKIRYFIFWLIFSSSGFYPYVFLNFILSIIKQRPIQITFILPYFILLSAFMTFYLYTKVNKFFLDEKLKQSLVFDKHSLTEKIVVSLVHEIKNPISAIQSLTQQMKKRYGSMTEENALKYFDIISDDLERIKLLTDSFLKIFKHDKEEENKADLYLIIQSINELIKFDLQKYEVSFFFDKNLLNKKVVLNNYSLKQIFLNLIYNSIEAKARNISVYSEDDKETVNIFIEDDGDGIKFGDINNIFKPFYTTKDNGMGIGLSLCKKILNENSGDIKLLSYKKGKTIFKITLNKNEAKAAK